MRVIHFSGGQSSALMTIENYLPGDLVIFCDTGRENPKTYKFINDFEARENIPVIRLTMPGGWNSMLKKMGGIPSMFKRKCTQELKVKTARRYLRSLGIIHYTQLIGFRTDEKVRREKYREQWKTVITRFPLTTDKQGVNSYWSKKPYRLEIPPILSNCDLCFMKGIDKIIAILTNDISLADKWIADEENEILNHRKATYIKGYTMREVKEIAQSFIDKGKIFDLQNIEAKFSCSCTA